MLADEISIQYRAVTDAQSSSPDSLQ